MSKYSLLFDSLNAKSRFYSNVWYKMCYLERNRVFCIRTSHTYNTTPPHEWNSMKTAWTILPNVNNVREKIFAEYKIQWHIMIRPLTWENFPIQRYYFVFKFMCLYMGVCISVIFPGIVGNKCFTSWRDNFFLLSTFSYVHWWTLKIKLHNGNIPRRCKKNWLHHNFKWNELKRKLLKQNGSFVAADVAAVSVIGSSWGC